MGFTCAYVHVSLLSSPLLSSAPPFVLDRLCSEWDRVQPRRMEYDAAAAGVVKCVTPLAAATTTTAKKQENGIGSSSRSEGKKQ